MYGLSKLAGLSGDAEDLVKLQELYGKVVADGQVYVPSRALVQSLFENGVGMERILRYRLSWRPKGTDRIAMFS